MMFLPPDDLRTAVTIQQTPDGGKIVTLTLQLWRGNTRTGALTQYKHSFSREYRRLFGAPPRAETQAQPIFRQAGS